MTKDEFINLIEKGGSVFVRKSAVDGSEVNAQLTDIEWCFGVFKTKTGKYELTVLEPSLLSKKAYVYDTMDEVLEVLNAIHRFIPEDCVAVYAKCSVESNISR